MQGATIKIVEHYLWKAYPYKQGKQIFQNCSIEINLSNKYWLYDKFISRL